MTETSQNIHVHYGESATFSHPGHLLVSHYAGYDGSHRVKMSNHHVQQASDEAASRSFKCAWLKCRIPCAITIKRDMRERMAHVHVIICDSRANGLEDLGQAAHRHCAVRRWPRTLGVAKYAR